MLKVLSGTLILFSNLKAIPQEICMILSSLRSLYIAKTSLQNMEKELRLLMRKEDMGH